MSRTDSTTTTTTNTSTTMGSFPEISASVAFASTDDSSTMESSSTTVSLSPSSSSPPTPSSSDHHNHHHIRCYHNDYDFAVLCRKVTSKLTTMANHHQKMKRRVTFGLHRNVTRRIEAYTDTWLTRAELKAIRCGGLAEMERHRHNFHGYLQTVDAATIHIQYSKDCLPKGQKCREKFDDSDQQKALVDTLTNVLISGCDFGFRGLEHASKDARHRRKGRNLAAAAICAKHRLLLTIGKSPTSFSSSKKEFQFRKFCEGLSYHARIWAYYMAMIDAAAARPEYTTIPPALQWPCNNRSSHHIINHVTWTVPKIVVVPMAPPEKRRRRTLPSIQLRHGDSIRRRRGYHRLEPPDDDDMAGAFPFLDDDDGDDEEEEEDTEEEEDKEQPVASTVDHCRADSSKTTTHTRFRHALQRLKASIQEERKVTTTNQKNDAPSS